MTVRVIRILEYVYPDHEAAERDMSRWNFPANGTKAFGKVSGKGNDWFIITSATVPPRTLRADEPINRPPEEEIKPKQCNDAYYKRAHDAHVFSIHEGPHGDVYYRCTGYGEEPVTPVRWAKCDDAFALVEHEQHIWTSNDADRNRYRCVGYGATDI
jgi:hypothetical protein